MSCWLSFSWVETQGLRGEPSSAIHSILPGRDHGRGNLNSGCRRHQAAKGRNRDFGTRRFGQLSVNRIERLQKCVTSLEAFDPQKARKRAPAVLEDARRGIVELPVVHQNFACHAGAVTDDRGACNCAASSGISSHRHLWRGGVQGHRQHQFQPRAVSAWALQLCPSSQCFDFRSTH
jgi:hypothetical protein